jgi:hypothetical protein
MFESFVANLLSSRASQFLKHVDNEKLRVGLWKGEVVLEDLELYVPAPAWQKSPCMPGQIAKDARSERR